MLAETVDLLLSLPFWVAVLRIATPLILGTLGVVAAAVFVAGVLVGADSMSRAVNVPTYIADVIVAVSLLSMLVATLAAQYRVVWRDLTAAVPTPTPAATGSLDAR